MTAATPKTAKSYVDLSASWTADLIFTGVVMVGVAAITAFLPLNWVPIVGPQAPGLLSGAIGALFLYRARSNNPLNWNP